MKYFAVIVVSCGVLFMFGSAEPPCHMQEVFTCLDIGIAYMNSLPRRSLPKTEQEVDEFCVSENSTYSCLKDYSKRCMTPIQRELASLATEGIGDFYEQFCVSTSSQVRTDYLAHAECLNKVTQGETSNENFHYLLAVVESFLSVPRSQWLEYLCCGYTKIYNLIRSDIVNTCSEEAAQAIENILHLETGQLPAVICTGTDGDSEECTALLPPPGSKPTEEIKENPVYKFVFSMLKHYLE